MLEYTDILLAELGARTVVRPQNRRREGIELPLPMPVKANDFVDRPSDDLVPNRSKFGSVSCNPILKRRHLLDAPLFVSISAFEPFPLCGVSKGRILDEFTRTFSMRMGDFMFTELNGRPVNAATENRWMTSVSQSTLVLSFLSLVSRALHASTVEF